MEALVRELGFADALRFMMQYRPGKGDYTKERRKLFAGESFDDLLAETIRRVEQQRPTRPTRAKRRSA